MNARSNSRTPREDGAVAVIVAIVALTLFAGAAIAVDLGNALVRKRGVQGQADFSALAGGAALPGTTMDASDPVVGAVAEYLIENIQQDDDDEPLPALETLKANLVNGDISDGQVIFESPSKLRVVAPQANVSFGLAAALGFSSTDVSAEATVEIGSPSKALPFYVSESCSFQQQTILNDPREDRVAPTPSLIPASDPSWTVGLDSLSPDETPLGTSVSGVRLSAPGHASLNGVTKIGFTTETTPESASVHIEFEIATGPARDGGNAVLTFDVDDAEVFDHEAVWYVRVFKDGSWSDDYLPFKVGEPPLYCAGAESGNFGALRLSRDDTLDGFWVAMNAASGILHDLALFPRSPAPSPCRGDTQSSMGESPSEPIPAVKPVNCVTTQNGSLAQATQGFITGVRDTARNIDVPGLLISDESTCDPSGGTSPRSVTIRGHGTHNLNNDVLTCYFNDADTTIRQVSAKVGAKEGAISPSIFESPRFFWMPVVNYDPVRGHSGSYPIVQFRAAFLTGQPLDASKNDPMRDETTASENGLKMEDNGIKSIDVVMINEDSLPDTADYDGELMAYIGTGPKIIRLVK